MVKRRELELIASRNYLLPKLDVVSVYRFYGIGHDLISQADGPFDSALGNLATGDFQEWAVGVEMQSPVGYRRGHAAVRHAELQLARDRAMLEEQEQQVVSDLAPPWPNSTGRTRSMRTNYNRRAAAFDQLQSLTALLRDADNVEKPRLLDLQLEAQRRLADAESQFFRALAEHEVAIKNVHLGKGSLLDYNQIYLTEGDWPEKAYYDAARPRAAEARSLPAGKLRPRRPNRQPRGIPATCGCGNEQAGKVEQLPPTEAQPKGRSSDCPRSIQCRPDIALENP